MVLLNVSVFYMYVFFYHHKHMLNLTTTLAFYTKRGIKHLIGAIVAHIMQLFLSCDGNPVA